MKTKKQLMDELAAKGIEFPANANKATLEELATANGISLELDTTDGSEVTGTEEEMPSEPGEGIQEEPANMPPVATEETKPDAAEVPEDTATDDRRNYYKELIAAKMKAGLSHEAAVEVIERQCAEDAKNQD